jgi:hypothetical protein
MTPQEANAELIAVQSQRISDLEAQLAELQHWRECGRECGATDGHALVLNYQDLQRENAELKEKLQAVLDLARATGG